MHYFMRKYIYLLIKSGLNNNSSPIITGFHAPVPSGPQEVDPGYRLKYSLRSILP
jgi:hypothetical protein